jgi:hypothetical protein
MQDRVPWHYFPDYQYPSNSIIVPENISLWPSSCRDPTSQPLPIHASPSSNPFSSARQTLSDFIWPFHRNDKLNRRLPAATTSSTGSRTRDRVWKCGELQIHELKIGSGDFWDLGRRWGAWFLQAWCLVLDQTVRGEFKVWEANLFDGWQIWDHHILITWTTSLEQRDPEDQKTFLTYIYCILCFG